MSDNSNNNANDKPNDEQATEIAQTIFDKIVYKKPSIVVGIGASAGALAALDVLCPLLSDNKAAAYILVQHLSPDVDSYMKPLLERKTNLIVENITDLMPIKANHFYILNERKNVLVADGKFILTETDNDRFHYPINHLLKSIASEYADRGVGVILSGSGTDGAEGAHAIETLGGKVFVQQPESAEYPSMPESAISHTQSPEILSLEKISARISEYIGSLKDIDEIALDLDDKNKSLVENIYALLNQKYAINFQQYKNNTFNRRVLHRMGMCGAVDLEQYYEILSKDIEEQELLKGELLIGVTEFFRDSSRWESLMSDALPSLYKRLNDDEDLRVWSVGCSSGQEVYSIAMLLFEYCESNNLEPRFKIFGTDLDSGAISVAGAGAYTRQEFDSIPFEFKHKYFDVADQTCIVKDFVRSKVIFAKHDILETPPFSKMDLVICRNMMIYLKPSSIDQTIAKIHFSLKPQGVLFVGDSESLGSYKDYFYRVNAHRFIYEKDGSKRIPLTSVELKRETFQETQRSSSKAILNASNSLVKRRQSFSQISRLREAVFDQFIPPSIVLNRKKEVIYSFADTSAYTEKIQKGAYSSHFSSILKPKLTPIVESLLMQLEEGKSRLVVSNVILEEDELCFSVDARKLDLLEESYPAAFIVSFSEPINVAQPITSNGNKQSGNPDAASNRIKLLDSELINAKLLVDETQRNLDFVTEELQVSNEELMASNEELHSVNEELFTVNNELNAKIADLEVASDELSLVLDIMDAGVIFLNSDFTIRRFTSAVRRYFSILPIDIGRPIIDLLGRFDTEEVNELLDKVKREECDCDQIVHVKRKSNDNSETVEMSVRVIQESSRIPKGFVILIRSVN